MPWCWRLGPLAHTLELFRLDSGLWTRTGSREGDAVIRADPFDAVELELGALWTGAAGPGGTPGT